MSHNYPLKPICFFVLHALLVSAYAQEVPSTSAEVVTVFGQGQTRQLQKLTRDDLAKALPGTSPLKTLEKLPGVSFQSADPFGAYEWSTRFSVRGFNQNQMGFTLDGVPLGDMSYGNNNGLHISRAISSENIGRVSLSQGAGAVGTASTSNLGGTVQFVSSDPSDVMGGTFGQTLGSSKTSRTFVRFDSGLLPSDTKFYMSVVRQRADKWKGAGSQNTDQFNSKVVQRIGDSKLTAFYNYSDRHEVDYQDVSLDMTQRLGWDWDNYQPDFKRAVNAANGVFTGGVTNKDDAYYLGRGLRKDNLAGVTLDSRLSDNANLKTTIYHHDNKGQGQWYTPYTPSSATMPISIRTTEYTINRDGFIGDLTWDLNKHSINGGVWLERSKHNLMRNFYAITGPDNTDFFLTNPFSQKFQQNFTTTTQQFFLQDTVALMDDKLKVNFGFKSPRVTIDAVSLVGTRAGGSITTSKSFLPQAGVNYALSKNDEVFTSIARNVRAFQPGVSGIFSQTQAAFDASKGTVKPETSTTIDLGYRFTRADMSGSVAVYHANFNDRLLSIQSCASIVGCPSSFVNVGKVETSGVEAAAVWKFMPHWSWFNSLTYNNSKYKSNYVDNGALVSVSGKQVVDTPKLMFNTEISWENEHYFARTDAKFTDKRYYTYVNDGAAPAFAVMNLSAGYKQKSFGALKDMTLQLNIDNLLQKKYYSTVGSGGFTSSDPAGTLQTLLTGAPRQVFITLSGKI